jgi:hypothetical protein
MVDLVGSTLLGKLIVPAVFKLTRQLYTDTIFFAPLSSSFDPTSTSSSSRQTASTLTGIEIKTRAEWIRVWMHEHGIDDSVNDEDTPLGPRPVSAKAVYRLADKLDLPALKLRAFQHISSQLTAQNIPAEVFSRFSSTFEDVRKVRLPSFLRWAIELTNPGASGILLEALDRNQEIRQYDPDLDADPTRKTCRFRRG